jgi:glycosyltransferase involved in cell wall biosynthesis
MFTNHLIAKFIKKKNKSIKWVADFRDFHFLKTKENNKGFKSLINQKLESSVIKKSDTITFISHSMKNIYSEYFNSSRNKMNTIYNGFDKEDLNTSNIRDTQNSKLSIFYSGSFYSGLRSPKPLLQILDKLIEEQLISENKLEIIIVGNFENQLKLEIANFKSFKCIHFIGRLNRNEVLKKQLEADLLWLIVGDKITHYTSLPLKFFEYIHTRRPIINFAPIISEPSSIIEKYNLGWNIDPKKHTFENQIKIFKEIVDKYNDGSLKIPIKQNEFDEFNRKYQTEQFENLLTKN